MDEQYKEFCLATTELQKVLFYVIFINIILSIAQCIHLIIAIKAEIKLSY